MIISRVVSTSLDVVVKGKVKNVEDIQPTNFDASQKETVIRERYFLKLALKNYCKRMSPRLALGSQELYSTS